MLYARVVKARSLLHRTISPLYIYLRDHNKLINPDQSKLNLSYANPINLVPDAPKHSFINFKLDPEMEVLLERQIFEEYKNKVLRGIVDEVEAVSFSLCRNNQIRSGEKIPSLFTTSIVSARTISWQSRTLNVPISKIASIKSMADILVLPSQRKSLSNLSNLPPSIRFPRSV